MLFGRSAELDAVGAVLDRARQQRGHTLVVRGEPGIGKTSLLEAAEQMAGRTMLVLRTRGVAIDSELPFSGLFDVLRPLFPLIDELPPAQAVALKGALGLSASHTADRFATATGTLTLLSVAADRQPLLVMIDDAQWLDLESTDCLMFACRRLHLDAVAFLWALRDDAERGPIGSEFDELALEPLDIVDMRRLVAENLLRQVVPEVMSSLAMATGGNPLTLTEAVRGLSDGQLRGHEPMTGGVPVRLSAVDLYLRRIERLSPSAVTLLTLFAVDSIGDTAVTRRAAELLGCRYAPLAEELEQNTLLRIEFGRAMLTNPLVRPAVERHVPPAAIRAAHRAYADALRTRVDPTARAWHLAAASTEPDESVARALDAAAAAAQARNAFSAASAAFRRAAALSVQDEDRAARLLHAAEAARQAGRPDDGRRLLQTSFGLATGAALKAAIEVEHARADLYHGRAVNARQLLESAAERVRQADPRHGAVILGQAACAAVLTGDLVRGAKIAERAAEMLPTDVREPIVELGLGYALLHQGNAGRSMSVLLAAAELTWERRAEVDPDYLPFAALALSWVGEYDRARELLAALLPAARAESSIGFLCFALYAAAYLEARTGHLMLAFSLASEGVSVSEQTVSNLWRYLSLCCLAFVEAAQGREAVCREHVEQALEIGREQEFAYPPTLLDTLGLLELAYGRWDSAIDYLEPANLQAGTGQPSLGRNSAPDLVEAYIRAGRPLSDSLVAQLRAGAADDRFPVLASAAHRCLGLIAPEDEMAAHFDEALRLHAEMNNPFVLARTEQCYGEQLRRAGLRREARRHLSRALALYRELGATQWCVRVDAELRAAGGTGQSAATTGLGGLTAQELQVALTVGRGLTNREAAAQMYVSPKTIEFHLSQIFRKLGLHSRAELAVRVTQMQGGTAATPA